MAKKSDIQRAMDHVNAQIDQLMQVRAALEATREAIGKVKPPKTSRIRKPAREPNPIAAAIAGNSPE